MKTRSASRLFRTIIGRLLALLALLTEAAPVFAQDAAPVRTTLALYGDKKVYKAGEPIRLVVSFTSEREGYQLNETTTKPASAVDSVTLSPDSGAYAWADQYTGGSGYFPDYSSTRPVSTKPATVALTLNDWYRFDRAGRYQPRALHGARRRAERDGGAGAHAANGRGQPRVRAGAK